MDQYISKKTEEWRETTLHPAKEKTPERKEKFVTSSDIVVPDLATEEDLRGFDAHKQLGYPANFLSPVAYSQPCIARASGPCASMLASARRKS